MAQRAERERTRLSIYEMPEDGIMNHMGWAEEYYLEDSAVLFYMNLAIRRAQILDNKLYLDKTELSEEDAKKSYGDLVRAGKIIRDGKKEEMAIGEPDYLKGERLEKLQRQLAEKVANIEKAIDHTYQASLLQECRITKYELAILSGISIPELVKSAQITASEEEMSALTQAYINMSSQDCRVNSGYFESEKDARFYDCITASPEINQRVLEMKF